MLKSAREWEERAFGIIDNQGVESDGMLALVYAILAIAAAIQECNQQEATNGSDS